MPNRKNKTETEHKAGYQLKVALRESQPLIWRRVQVPGNITLHRLHMILQKVMGWTNSHLYLFKIGGVEYILPEPDEPEPAESRHADPRKNQLGKLVSTENSKFTYIYDFGDGWEHEILVEKILPAHSDVQYPVCLAGKRAGPPEDCGGIRGYAELLKIIRDPLHEQYEETMEWLGGTLAPEEFNIDRINRSLAHFHRKDKSKRSVIPEVFRQAFKGN